MVNEGEVAPDFELRADDGSTVTLRQFRGKKVILYFYPKDNTPGCTKEACDFRDSASWFDGLGIAVLGVSKDSLDSHRKFREKHKLIGLIMLEQGMITNAQLIEILRYYERTGRGGK